MDEVSESEIKSFESEETSEEDDVLDNESYDILNESSMWQSQSLLTEAQQNDQPVLQITLQEVINMIDITAHKEMIGDDVRREEMIGDDVRHEEMIGDDIRHEETGGNKDL